MVKQMSYIVAGSQAFTWCELWLWACGPHSRTQRRRLLICHTLLRQVPRYNVLMVKANNEIWYLQSSTMDITVKTEASKKKIDTENLEHHQVSRWACCFCISVHRFDNRVLYLQWVECPLPQVVSIEQLKLMEKFNEEVRSRLILRDQCCHLRIDRLSQGLKKRKITAHI